MSEVIIFYSWQADDKNSRNYISKVLNDVVDYINRNSTDGTLAKIEKDTKGKIGSPNIPNTIEEKIRNCDIFIADLSVISEFDGKKQINQNVMYETGYAISAIGDAYCILLHNTDSCEPKDLPFDIAQRRLLTYSRKNNNLKEALLNALALSLENAKLHKIVVSNDTSLSAWEQDILALFKSIKGEKRIIVSRVGLLNFGIYGDHDVSLTNKMSGHSDPQEIRAAFQCLVDDGYLELFYSDRGAPNYRLLQKGYDYLNNR